MNYEKMLHYANIIENSKRFDMSHWIWDSVSQTQILYKKEVNCNTVCCIAGEIVLQTNKLNNNYYFSYFSTAKKELELSNEQAVWLFNGYWRTARELYLATPKEAAAAMRAMVKHNGIPPNKDWLKEINS